nr:HlyD family efflux transporter periplasmic adaptor subunit [Salinivirgaceae bacterium]
RWGITTFFIILAVLLVGSNFFAYPDVAQGEIEIISENPPVEIRSRVSAQIDSLPVTDNQFVKKEDVIAVMQNPAHYQHVQVVHEYVNRLQTSQKLTETLPVQLPEDVGKLGTLQSHWSGLISQLKEYNRFVEEEYYGKKIQTLTTKIEQQQSYVENLHQQLAYARKSLRLTQSQFAKDSLLFARSVIAESEFERSEQTLIQQKQAVENQRAAITQAQLQLTNYNDQLTDYRNSSTKELGNLLISIRRQMEEFMANYATWEETYLIRAPKAGMVSFTGIWSAKQPVQAGEVVCTIVPGNTGQIIGRVKLQKQGAGKVEKGQRVNIKLADFPYLEFGMVQGTVRNVALVPQDDYYWAYVDLDFPLQTTYHKQIDFRQRMTGTAEIVTKDLSVLDRMLQPIMYAISDRS